MVLSKLKSLALALAAGLLAGAAASVFLYLLDYATRLREAHDALLWSLPLCGLVTALLYHHFGAEAARGHNLILDEIHEPRATVPLRMAPLVLVGTVLTHLGGGSAGREGTAVQMGGSLADQLALRARTTPAERKRLLMCGLGAGFGAAIGAPLAGAVFGVEVIRTGRLRLHAFTECLVASFAGFAFTQLVHAPHSHFPRLAIAGAAPVTFLWIALAGLAFGLAARAFVALAHVVEKASARALPYAPLRPVVGGMLVLAGFWLLGHHRYAGLGIPFIQEALLRPAPPLDPLGKAFLTALTVGSGFKGGEFVPLVFVGTTLGSALSLVIPVSLSLLASVGFAAVFGAAANTPLACAVMAAEIFGIDVLPFALVACWVGYLVSGEAGLYRSQRHERPKHWLFRALLARVIGRK